MLLHMLLHWLCTYNFAQPDWLIDRGCVVGVPCVISGTLTQTLWSRYQIPMDWTLQRLIFEIPVASSL
jgi:hypothetical protein